MLDRFCVCSLVRIRKIVPIVPWLQFRLVGIVFTFVVRILKQNHSLIGEFAGIDLINPGDTATIVRPASRFFGDTAYFATAMLRAAFEMEYAVAISF